MKWAVGQGGDLEPATGTIAGGREEPGATRGESGSSSKMLVQPGEEISTLSARNYSLCWHGQGEKYGKQGD